MRAALLLLVAAAACGPSSLNRVERWRASADIEIDARGLRRRAPSAGEDARDSVDGGLSLRAQGGPGRLNYALGLDAHLGAGTGGGFAYDAALHLVGIGLALGDVGSLALTAGYGVNGVTGCVPLAHELPVELRLGVDLNPRVHVRMFAMISALADDAEVAGGERERNRRVGATLRLGKGGRRHRERWSNGLYLGVIAGDRLGVRELGLVAGYGISDRYVPHRYEPVGL